MQVNRGTDRFYRILYRSCVILTPIAVFASITLWLMSYETDEMPTYAILGAYNHAWFVLNILVSYLTLWCVIFVLFKLKAEALINIIVLHGSLLVLLILLEAPAAMGLINYQTYFPSGMSWRHEAESQWVQPNITTEGDAPSDLNIVYGIDAPLVHYKFQSDRFGLRNPRDKDDAAVLLLGDSILVAGLVPVEQTVAERLETALGKPVMNISQIGYSPQDALERMDGTRLDLNNRLVVHFIFEGNDLLDHMRWREKKVGEEDRPWIPTIDPKEIKLPWPDSGLGKSLLNMLLMHKPLLPDRRAAICANANVAPQKVYFFYDAGMIRDNMKELPYLENTIGKAKLHIESRGGQYAIAFVPAKITVLHNLCKFDNDSHYNDPQSRESEFPGQLASLCNKLNIPFVNMTPALKSVSFNGQLPYLHADTHLNSAGHEAMAQALKPLITDLLTEIDHTKNRATTHPDSNIGE